MNDGADDSDLIIPPDPLDAGWDDVRSYDDRSLEVHALEAHAFDGERLGAPPASIAEPFELSEDDVQQLDAYTEDDNAVTQEFAGLLAEPRWLVQFTPLDRRMLDTSDVISALLNGEISRQTLVWRGGMDDWVPVGRLDLLAVSAIPTLPPQRRSGVDPRPARGVLSGAPLRAALSSGAPPAGARPVEITLASLAIALSAATITTSFLSIAGVFDAHRAGEPPRVQALRPEPVERRDSPAEAAPVRVADEPAPPDPDRATAVAH